jgi:hypothetical protein
MYVETHLICRLATTVLDGDPALHVIDLLLQALQGQLRVIESLPQLINPAPDVMYQS